MVLFFEGCVSQLVHIVEYRRIILLKNRRVCVLRKLNLSIDTKWFYGGANLFDQFSSLGNNNFSLGI